VNEPPLAGCRKRASDREWAAQVARDRPILRVVGGPAAVGKGLATRLCMRVVLFADAPAGGREAAAAIVERITDDLVRLGHEIALVVTPGMPTSRAAGLQVRLHTLPFPWLTSAGVRALDAFHPQLVHVLTARPISMLARAYAQAHALPLVCTLHADYPGSVRHWGEIDWLLAVYRDAGAPIEADVVDEPSHRPSGVYSIAGGPLTQRL
jgi:hypothetical protein